MNSQQPSNRQAETTQIPRGEWGSFLDRFSELNRETTTRVELLGPEQAAYQLLVEERPLLDITLDDEAGPPQLIVECGDTGGSAPAAFRHLIQEPTAIRARGYGADDWDALIPRLPVRARGFLRLRRDMPAATQDLLDRLGIRDRGLPSPDVPIEQPMVEPIPLRPVPANDQAEPDDQADSEIGALVRRIETFRKTRASRPAEEAPQLPLGERSAGARPRCEGFAFTADTEGRIDWADSAVAPMVVGAILPAAVQGSRRQFQPLRGVSIEWEGAPPVAGEWVIDAAPRFSQTGGRFVGYAGRFRRPSPGPGRFSESDLHAVQSRMTAGWLALLTPKDQISCVRHVNR